MRTSLPIREKCFALSEYVDSSLHRSRLLTFPLFLPILAIARAFSILSDEAGIPIVLLDHAVRVNGGGKIRRLP
jgi:hypothetical protein